MKNKDIYQKPPKDNKPLNDGVVSVIDVRTDEDREVLRFELEHFVCDGEYRHGLVRILNSYTSNSGKPHQPAAWISGFYGSGKSHLAKMLRFLWGEYEFPEDKAKARVLARLPDDVKALFQELSTLGKRGGGLFAAAGVLGATGKESVRLSLLAIMFRAANLPTSYPQAKFSLWLRRSKLYGKVYAAMVSQGRKFDQELRDMYVSPYLAKALLEINPDFAENERGVGAVLRSQYKNVDDISSDEFIDTMREVLLRKQLPCTVLILDELQQYIGEDVRRSHEVQEVVETCCKRLDGKLLFVGTGQSALSSTPALQRLQGRFTINVQLSDNDVGKVIHQVMLAKREDRVQPLREALDQNAGEIHRHLADTQIKHLPEDDKALIQDYPLLPVRRRFWEHSLRALDRAGATGQLRTQLRIVYEAIQATAEQPLANVVPADFLYSQIASNLLGSGQLPREMYDKIQLQGDAEEGRMGSRVCALVLLIRKLPREKGSDLQVRATQETLIDLLVQDLEKDRPRLEKQIPQVLKELLDQGILMKLEQGEYALQTQQGSEWDAEFKERRNAFQEDPVRLSSRRSQLLEEAVNEAMQSLTLLQGVNKESRKLTWHSGPEAPDEKSATIPIWIRNGWSIEEGEVKQDAQNAGTESPVLHVFIPKSSSEHLAGLLADEEAAKETLACRSEPTDPAGIEARQAMEARRGDAEREREKLIKKLLEETRVFQGGGSECQEALLMEKLIAGAQASLERLFHEFHHADDKHWRQVLQYSNEGVVNPLKALGYQGPVEKHPVCIRILSYIESSKKGREIREHFAAPPYGWPRDVVDGAINILCESNHLHVFFESKPLKTADLDRRKIAVAEFRRESVTLSTQQILALRGLFREAGVPCDPHEESAKAKDFLQAVRELAGAVGGEEPLPEKPDTAHLGELKVQMGNEQLQAILEQQEQLQKEIQDWKAQGKLKEQRLPQYKRLRTLLDHARGLPIYKTLVPQVIALKQNRSLLQPDNPLGSMEQELTKALHIALTEAEQKYAKRYDEEKKRLDGLPNWQKLSESKQKKLLAQRKLDKKMSKGSIDTPEELCQSLEQCSLDNWRDRRAALLQHFKDIFLAAEPSTELRRQQAKLPRTILHSPEEVQKWTEESQKQLLKLVKKGPVIVP